MIFYYMKEVDKIDNEMNNKIKLENIVDPCEACNVRKTRNEFNVCKVLKDVTMLN